MHIPTVKVTSQRRVKGSDEQETVTQNRSRGFGFVQFLCPRDAARVVKVRVRPTVAIAEFIFPEARYFISARTVDAAVLSYCGIYLWNVTASASECLWSWQLGDFWLQTEYPTDDDLRLLWKQDI